MATVPGDPNEPTGNVTQMLPKQFQPTMADFLQATAIMDQKQRFAQTDRPLLPIDVLGTQMSKTGLVPGPGRVGEPLRPPGTGMKELEDVRFKTEQEQIRKNLPPPKTEMQRAKEHDQRTDGSIMDNDSLWAIARDTQERQKVPFSRAFSNTVQQVLGRSLTAEELAEAMIGAAKHGIGQ